MNAKIIDGKVVAAGVDERTRALVERLAARGVTPGLAVVLVGDDPASHTYVGMKERSCARLGIGASIRGCRPRRPNLSWKP